MNKIIKCIKNPKVLLYYLDQKGFFRMKDEEYIKTQYKMIFNKELNLKKTKTFNEKLQWIKLYDRNPKYTKMVDKYEVKKYIENILGDEYVIPTIGIYKSFDDIDFEKLPNQFVMKCTHNSGGLIICKDKTKLNIKEIKRKINKSLSNNFFYSSREWPYKNVKPRILVEKYMETKSGELEDYKFYCFNGKVDYVMYCCERNTGNPKFYYFDRNWDMKREFSNDGINNYKRIEKPENLEKMFDIASKLSKNIPFVRVDLYNINGNIYFGEMTFFPSGGLDNTRRKEVTDYLSSMLNIEEVNNEKNWICYK